ncbi:hypothetical protein HQ865_15290 [Mucilaginibacter mali]|uniref:Uncharacterized protein n=1 Tax=Mucilaginibacter mali TaxID=2740462 RepID=A0A7D4UPT3_9SPHI|nr:hypothetical protein [Mucilaginibacter mali]QKJ31060.1 hypothetical protein HQ865_15290 [Mucilaginibacter mali]
MLKRFYHIDQATGVSINKLSDTSFEIDLCSISLSKDQLKLEKKIIGITNLDELTKQAPAGSPVAINLTGKGILTKSFEQVAAIDHSNFSRILPNANFSDFYVQHFVSGERSYVSVIRKTDADQWIARLKQIGLKPLLLSLDIFPADMVLPQLNSTVRSLCTGGYHITWDNDGEWTNVQRQEPGQKNEPLKIDNETIGERLLLPYAAAFGLAMTGRIPLVSAIVPELSADLSNELENRKFKAGAIAVLCTIFLLLIVNFAVFSWLNDSNNELMVKVGFLTQSTSDRTNLENNIQQKELLLRNSGWHSGVLSKSILTDQMAAEMPAGIKWTSLNIDPVDNANGRTLKNISFFDRRITATGQAEQVIAVNEWIARLKTKPWLKNIRLDSYNFNQELNTGQFTLIINY